METIEKAIIYAGRAHASQLRKSTNIPYITHPYAVGMMLQRAKCSDEVIAAGILHDTLEDTSATYEDLKNEFGDKIASLVKAASEHDKSLSWEERKEHTIETLKYATIEEIQVITADKLHNLKSIHHDLLTEGEDIWTRFKRGKREQHWYYASTVMVLAPRKKEFRLISDLEKEVKAVFGSLQILTKQEISLLFSCVYAIPNEKRTVLDNCGLLSFAESLLRKAERIYLEKYDLVAEKLQDLKTRGISFQSNSEGPFLLASFSIAFQQKMNWTDEELFEHLKRNLSLL